MADLFIEKVFEHDFTNRDGYPCSTEVKGIAIRFLGGKTISFKEGVTRAEALEIIKKINDIILY